jgi:hypothetical protein
MKPAILLLGGWCLLCLAHSPSRLGAADSRKETAPPAESTLIERGRLQAESAAAEYLHRRLFWGGVILAGLALAAGAGAGVWWFHRRRRRSRTNQIVKFLLFPTAYSVPPEPPVSDALPRMEPHVSPKMRSAA